MTCCFDLVAIVSELLHIQADWVYKNLVYADEIDQYPAVSETRICEVPVQLLIRKLYESDILFYMLIRMYCPKSYFVRMAPGCNEKIM